MPGADQSGASQGYTIHMVKKSFNSQDVGEEQQQKKIALPDWSVFLCAVDLTFARRRMCRTGELSQELFFSSLFFHTLFQKLIKCKLNY